MKIRLLVSRAGNGFSQNRGDEIEVADPEAIRMINAGQAEALREPVVERAVKAPRAERAVK